MRQETMCVAKSPPPIAQNSELCEQLDLIPEFVAACGFQNAKLLVTRPMTF